MDFQESQALGDVYEASSGGESSGLGASSLEVLVDEQTSVRPKRVMGAFSATMIVVASMIGTGVFTTTGILLVATPSPMAVLWAWLIGGVIAFFGAVSYAELVAMYPQNGGEFQLLTKIFHPAVGFVAGWVSLIVGFSAPIASAAMAFGAYASSSFGNIDPFWAGLGIILVLSLVHAIRVSLGSIVQNFFTVAKIALVLCFIFGGMALGDFTRVFSESPIDTGLTMLAPSFAVGLIYVTYAYTGWNGSAYLAGEIKDPSRSLPRALAMGTALVTIIYIGLNLVFLSAAPVSELSGSIEVGAVAATALFGSAAGKLFSGLIALLLVSSLSAMIMAGPRIYQSMGEYYPSFKFLTKRTKDSGPYYAICFQAIIAVLMLMTARFDALISYMGFTLSVSAILTVIGVFVMRKRMPKLPRPYKCWGYPVTPLLFIGLSLWMVIFTIFETPLVALSGGATIVVGLGLYWMVKPRGQVVAPFQDEES